MRAPHLVPAERRASSRCDVLERQLVAVDLRCDNGGIVLNCSLGGLAIQAVAPPPQGPGHELLVYLPDVPNPVVATCDVVWVNEFHQAGIRFTAMPGITRTRFAEWLDQTARTHPPRAENMPMLPGSPARHEPSMTQGPVPARPMGPLASTLHPNPPHTTLPQGATQVPAMDDPEPWRAAFAAAAVLSLVLMLLFSLVLRRTTSLPSQSSMQQTQDSVPITPTTPPAAVQTLATKAPPRPPSASPPEPPPATRPRTVRHHSRQVRRGEQGDDDDEVIVRHFTHPAPPGAAQTEQTSPLR